MNITNLLSDIFVTAAELAALAVALGLIALLASWATRLLTRVERLRRLGDLSRFQGRIRSALLVVFLFSAAGILIFNVSIILQGERVWPATVAMISSALGPDFGWRLLRALVAIGLLIVAARFVVRLIRRWLPRLEAYTRRVPAIRITEKQRHAVFAALDTLLYYGIWLAIVVSGATLLGLPEGFTYLLDLALKVFLIVAVGRLLVTLIAPTINTLDALSEQYIRSTALDEFYTQLHGLIPLLSTTLEFLVYVGAATVAVSQIDAISSYAEFGTMALKVIVVIFLTRLATEAIMLVVDKTFLVRGELTEDQWRQRLTFAPLMKSIIRYGVIAAAALFVLTVLGFDIGPILVGLGGVGLVLGLAAQPVTTDLISGLFILFENLFRVGDYIETGDAKGLVESIDARTTRIRDSDGRLHLVRNGQIGTIINYSKGYVYAVVSIGIAHRSDLQRAFSVIEECGRVLDERLEDVLEPTIVQGIEEFGAEGILVRTITRVQPGRHEQSARDLRLLIKEAFERENIARAVAGEPTGNALILTDSRLEPTSQERSQASAPEQPSLFGGAGGGSA